MRQIPIFAREDEVIASEVAQPVTILLGVGDVLYNHSGREDIGSVNSESVDKCEVEFSNLGKSLVEVF